MTITSISSQFLFAPATKEGAFSRTALIGPPGSGKAQPLDAPILTPTGWRSMGTLAVGDRITSAGGGSTSVTGIYPQGEQPVYQITFSDGATVECTADHLWLTRTRNARRDHTVAKVRTLREIMNTLHSSDGQRNHSVPLVEAVEFDAPDDLPIDPWLLGILLGDGHLSAREVRLSSADVQTWDAVTDVLPTGLYLRPVLRKPCDATITGGMTGRPNPLVVALRALGLNDTRSHNKFVPDLYLYGSAKVRLAILQGLLDSDGFATGSTLEYSTCSPRLAEHVRFLVESLGGLVTSTVRIPSCTNSGVQVAGKPSHRMYLKVPGWLVPFRLDRKNAAYRPKTKYQPLRLIESVDLVGVKPVQCISVDASDHLYVTANFVVTHNTWTALTIAQAFDGTTGVIDTERRSAAKYSDVFGFQHLPMTDFNPATLTAAIAAAAEQHIGTLIIDSWSHFWEGSGGMLEQVDRATARAGRSDKFGSGWKEMRPVERAMVDAIISYPGHVIITLRTKVEYVVERNATTGREGPKRIGLKPVQRDGVEYEFDLVGDMDDATLTVTKSRCPELTAAVIVKPTDELGYTIDRWLKADAVGEPLNPITVRDWAMEPERTVDELHGKFLELEAAGTTGAAVNSPNGKTWPLGEFVQACERALRRRLAEPVASELGTALTEAAA